MRMLSLGVAVFLFQTVLAAAEMKVHRDIPYVESADTRQKVDVYAPAGATSLPVIFWIHGGGWVTGDRSLMHAKPQAFVDTGFVIVSPGYRVLTNVDMVTICRDVAKAFAWMEQHITEYGGDPKRVIVSGHSAGAQLAALLCIDERYLKAEGVSMDVIKGCIPVDGDTYDVPAIIEVAETRRRAHGLSPITANGHRQKFGNSPEKHKDYSAVTHVAKGKGIAPFLIMHVAGHPDVSAQAERLENVLKGAGVSVKRYGAKESTHNKINEEMGLADDPGTKAVFDFVAEVLRR